ncbi:MAG TPA: hypothetical protein VHU86_00140 [Solirubrobacterales bacterium]|jgi:hypothetical protein|nr:hypothetical protein [Solirubrobacterales bacterium]
MRRLTRGSRLRLALLLAAFVAAPLLSATSFAAVIQTEGLRISVLSQLIPYKLPRGRPAPIAVFVSGHLSTADGAIPPQLQKLTVEVNRHGLLQSRGLPVCQIPQIQPASTARALADCGDALIGSGQFWAHIVLPDQRPYPTQGRLLIFNGRRHSHPVLLAQIYTSHPFNSSFVIAFAIRHVSQGPYGTELSASLPEALGEWGYLDRIKLTLRRKYRYQGKELSYFNAACPAPKGAPRASFPLAYATFSFAGRPPLSATVDKTCGVKE